MSTVARGSERPAVFLPFTREVRGDRAKDRGSLRAPRYGRFELILQTTPNALRTDCGPTHDIGSRLNYDDEGMTNKRKLVRAGHRRLAFVLLLAAVLCGVGSAKKKRAATAHALVAGTVFHASGRSLRGAKVTVFNETRPKKKLRGVTDIRGEFAIRVPSGEARYVVQAAAKGFESAEKKVQTYGMEKVNVNFMLSPKDGGKRSK